MRRRAVLEAAALLPLLPFVTLAPARPLAPFRRVRPTDPSWPSRAEWDALKSAVGGNLLQVQPLFAPCAAAPDGAACQDVYRNIRNPFYIGDQPGGTQVSGWLDAWTPAPSAWAVKARSAADVAAAVNFARTHKLRVVVKGGAHSYLGTSNAPDSLLIWTRAMNQIAVEDAFVPKGCDAKVAPTPALTLGAGCVWIDAYSVVTTRGGRYVQGGGCTSVGVAGLIQSGGFGSFSKGFGNAAAGLLEAEVVTADGRARIANACTDPDLFWALKGGGGGTFGVVTRLTLRTHELPQFFGGAWGTVKARSDEAFRRLVARFVAFYAESLANPHWGEQIAVKPDNSLNISMVQQGLSPEEARAVWKPFFEFVGSSKDLAVTQELGAGAHRAQSWWEIAANPSMIPDQRPGAAPDHGWWQGDQDQVGGYLHGYESLWLPASLLKQSEQPRLAEALFAASRYKDVGLHINKGLAFAPAEAIRASLDTAMNPAVTEAFALAIIADAEGPCYPGMKRPPMDLAAARSDARSIDRATDELRKVAPEPGSYLSESNYFNKSWQQAYFGANYPRLRAIKKKYDPAGLFFVHNGVGSEEWSADGFTRLS
ncbi:MAG TPA: FAD-binding protein [Steroidobacteraceae bacterium]|nr:FAD-binding protein [Steroidobacteraceae bacterium]